MATFQTSLVIQTQGRGFYELTDKLRGIVAGATIETGLMHMFVQHTSASLLLCEHADPDVRHDLDQFMSKLVPDGHPSYVHSAEGPDDMPAHIRSVLTQNSLSIPIQNHNLALGTWQGLYLWEHRTYPHRRSSVVTLLGT
ncbi:MAG: YjbQ family protein [Myxococcales bacterium]|nr:MAG: YjbQ family protein [Myxococcales bacterium]